LVLEPNKEIYRYDQTTNEEYYITVTEDTISELQQEYMKAQNQSYSTLEHDGKELDGVTFVEHWIVGDSKIDKSALHGLNFKKGSWVSVAKIDNDDLWNDAIKNGKVMGFSIDALVQLEEVNLNKQTMSEQKEFLAQLKEDVINTVKNTLGLSKKEDFAEVEKEVELAEVAEVVEEVKDEAIEVEAKGFDLDEFKKVMDELGVSFSEVVKDALKPIQDSNLELSKEVETLKAELVEYGKQPASKSIKSTPSQVDFSKMTNKEKMEFNRLNKR